jgi:hypothetical protein
MQSIGGHVDCYFTVEDIHNAGSKPLLHIRLPASNRLATVQDVVAFLKMSLQDNAEITQESKVIHLVSRNLKQVSGYWLESKVNVDYVGTPTDGLAHILGKIKQAEIQTGFSTSSPPQFDMTTRIWIVGNNASARKILTDCLPLSQYSRILWVARTDPADDNQIAYISFGGQVKPVLKLSEKLSPFNLGEDAYRTNQKSDEGRKAALEFLSTEMKKETPCQARWAMFYLSQFEDAEITNTLLEHLTYCYSEIGPLEERYPAVLSLVMQGDPTVEPAIQQLLTEEDPLRTKLLTYVILAVKGKDEGQKSIRTKTATLNDKQRDRIEKAMMDVLTTTKLKVSQQENEKKADAASPA